MFGKPIDQDQVNILLCGGNLPLYVGKISIMVLPFIKERGFDLPLTLAP